MKVVGEGILPSPARSFAWSPTVDLCVFVMAKEVSAHRLSGQKVWSVSGLHTYDVEFTHVTWRDDGRSPLGELLMNRERYCDWVGWWICFRVGRTRWSENTWSYAQFTSSRTDFVFELDWRGCQCYCEWCVYGKWNWMLLLIFRNWTSILMWRSIFRASKLLAESKRTWMERVWPVVMQPSLPMRLWLGDSLWMVNQGQSKLLIWSS